MLEKGTSNVSPPSPQRQDTVSIRLTTKKSALPMIHPDDAKDKVFTAILKALLKKGNKPSSPKELAHDIVKHKYATLGGATPFATVSSRISQHFKRAAQHNPPRAPLLAKHVDQHHSRKIQYSLIAPGDTTPILKSSSDIEQPLAQQSNENYYADNDNVQSAPINQDKPTESPPQQQDNGPGSNGSSDAEYSDYFEDMMKGDETMAHIEIPKRRSSVRHMAESPKLLASRKLSPNPSEFWSPYAYDQDLTNDTLLLPEQIITDQQHLATLNIVSPESISESELDLYFSSGKAARTSRNSFSGLSDEKEPSNLHRSHINGSDDDEEVLTRRKSWPLVGTSPPTNTDPIVNFIDATTQSSNLHPSNKENIPETTDTKEELPVSKSYSENGHRFTITKKYIGPLLCYELDSPDDIPDTKVLRFIEFNDCVANRTRHATDQHSSLLEGCVNATLLRKAATPVLGPGGFDAADEIKQGRWTVTLTLGSLECHGDWVTLARARELVDEFEIESSPGLAKLLSDHPMVSDRHGTESPSPLKGTFDLAPDEFVQFEEDERAPTFDTAALQQLMASIPGLSHTQPTPELVSSFASYMKSVGNPTLGSFTLDLKSTLARFQALDAIFNKNSSQSTATKSTSNLLESNKIYPTTPTHPPMYITVIDNVTVCVATLEVQRGNDTKSYPVVRRLDTGFVNGTSLLIAGGIETERERSMILSFEMERIRIPNKRSKLCGTWIPLHRAQELAATCSIRNRLTGFLSDRLEGFLPSSLPSTQPLRRRASSGNGTTTLQDKILSSTRLQQLLLSHPYKTLTPDDGTCPFSLGVLKAPLLGTFERTADQRATAIITNHPLHKNEPFSDDDLSDATESDTDVKKIRHRNKRRREAAINAMDMEELLSRASGPIVHRAPIQRQRFLYDINEEPLGVKTVRHGRRRPPATTMATCVIKKSASWSGEVSRPGVKRKRSVVRKHTMAHPDLTSIFNDKVPETIMVISDEDELIDIGGSDDDDDVR